MDQVSVNVNLHANSDGADDHKEENESSLDVVGHQGGAQSANGGVDQGDDHLNDGRRKTIKTGERGDDG